MKQTFLLVLIFIGLTSFAQKGTVSGNAFWKYNDFVGTRPDAGSTVSLFYPDSSRKQLETICDGNGNFKFEGVDTGKCLVVIVSKNTRPDILEMLNEPMYSNLKPYFGFDLKSLDSQLFDSVEIYSKAYFEASTQNATSRKEMKEKDKKTIEAAKIYMKACLAMKRKIPINDRTLNSIWSCASSKVKIQEVQVKPNENVNIVADFGLTAY